ncbi:hypothetical protein M8494_28060 [Serratia ureilytica]
MERIVELTPGALRSYGGNYDDYRRQRDMEQQAVRADRRHARERRRTASTAASATASGAGANAGVVDS